MRTCIFIPARGGSVGVKHKNLRKVGEKSLLERAVKCGISSRVCENDVWVSSDSDAILTEAERFGARAHKRSHAASSDIASTEEAMAEFWSTHPLYDAMILMQATSPLTHPNDVAAAHAMFCEKGCDSLLSVEQLHRFRWAKTGEEWTAANYDPTMRPRRQDWSGEMYETGAFYITRREGFHASGSRLWGRIEAFCVDSSRSIDVDTEDDLTIANAYLSASNGSF
jgi:CMP-N-acetylneuraminic acid synthetase